MQNNQPNHIKKTLEKDKGKIPYSYSMSLHDLVELFTTNKDDPVTALCMAYDYGFIRGTRAEKRKSVPSL